MNRPGQQRDMVFCHVCENEWYREEHGLECPSCHSDFTEIIEQDHDPRVERQLHVDDEDSESLPSLLHEHEHQHNPWRDAPDPDEEDIDGVGNMWPNEPRDRSRTPQQSDLAGGHPLMQNFATMLQGIAGRSMSPRMHQDDPASANRAGTRILRHGPHMEIRREGPNASFYFSSYSSGPSTFGGSGRQDPPDHFGGIPSMVAQLFAELEPGMSPSGRRTRGGPGSPDAPPMSPLQMLFSSLLGPPGGVHGDAVYSQEGFDRVMSQLMEQNQTGNAPGPASADAIASLPAKRVDKSMLDDQGKAECSICMDEVKLNDSVKGIPVLFIPGNAGSYKQVRPLAAEAANYFHDVLRHDGNALRDGKRTLDFFSVDFNEDITAFHGQTLLDQAEYLNDAISFILSLYHDPNRSVRETGLPDPSSVMIIGHSMGGVVARTMLTMPNYQTSSINTIVTLSAPHSRPPVSFDGEIVKTYSDVNSYWRKAHSQKWANKNPLWHVTLVSITGGALDTMVPSEYASLASIVPETHGFTVFTSSIPDVWTGMDHLAIMWCDQFRKSIIRALYDVADVRRPSQTQPRAERMRIFRKRLLTGMEDIAEKLLPQEEPRTLLTLEDKSNAMVAQGERLTLREFGKARKPRAHLLPVPPQGTNMEGTRFTLLSNQPLDANSPLEVLFCSVFPLQSEQRADVFSMNMDLSEDNTGSTRLACKSGASDAIVLPASTRESQYPFDHAPPFSYLQYDLEALAEHQFVAVVDKAKEPTAGWVMAEFSAESASTIRTNIGLRTLLTSGLDLHMHSSRSMVNEINIPALYSGLLSYKISISKQGCEGGQELFTPLLRQYVSEPYESKFFVNVQEADINIHGVAPYMPPPLKGISAAQGLSLQIWSDPTCDHTVSLSLKLDFIGSMGKLVMRYRTVFAAFPLLVVALVLRKQFSVYDETGTSCLYSQA
ncbi:MAG: hypothetical protein Q9165_002483 [Trypethelium subeluteriae]